MSGAIDFDRFTLAYHTGTGEKRYVPNHYLTTAPMSEQWKVPPSVRNNAPTNPSMSTEIGDDATPETSAESGDDTTPAQPGANSEEN